MKLQAAYQVFEIINLAMDVAIQACFHKGEYRQRSWPHSGEPDEA